MHRPAITTTKATRKRRELTEPLVVCWLLIAAALLFLGLFLFVPLAAVFAQALEKGWDVYLESIREADADGSIVMLSAEKERPYARPPLSKGLWLGKPEESVWLLHDPRGELVAHYAGIPVRLRGPWGEAWGYVSVDSMTAPSTCLKR